MIKLRLKIYFLNDFVDFYTKQFPDLLQDTHKYLGSKQGCNTTQPQDLGRWEDEGQEGE